MCVEHSNVRASVFTDEILDSIAMATLALLQWAVPPPPTQIQWNDKSLPVLPPPTVPDPAPAKHLPSIHFSLCSRSLSLCGFFFLFVFFRSHNYSCVSLQGEHQRYLFHRRILASLQALTVTVE